MEKSRIETLVEKVSAGDKYAFKELCEYKYKNIYYQALNILGNHYDAEDVTQIVVLKVYQNIKNLRDSRAFNVWLYRIVKNECNLYLKRKINRKEDFTYEENSDLRKEQNEEIIPGKHINESELTDVIAGIIEKMPKKRQMIFHLHFFEGLKYREIAEVENLSINTVASNVKRAKEIIKKEIENNSNLNVLFESGGEENG